MHELNWCLLISPANETMKGFKEREEDHFFFLSATVTKHLLDADTVIGAQDLGGERKS